MHWKLSRTEGRDRTGTSVTSSVFETDASTDSATSAWFDKLTMYGSSRQTRVQRYVFFLFLQAAFEKNAFFSFLGRFALIPHSCNIQ